MFTMETLGSRRLVKDLKSLQKNPPAGISVAPNESDSLTWKAIILGPDDTHWEEGVFELTLEFPENYPNQPPVVRFVSQMFHPNIYDDGTICLDILDSQWTPVLDVASILISIQSLLCDPNLDSPANPSAALMYTSDREEYNRKVREMVDQSWRAG